MSFLSFSVKNPFRNKLRTIFVIIFLIIGILAITSSMALSHVSTQIFDANFNIGGANLNILGDKYLSSNDLNTIKNIDGVQNAVGVSIYTLNSENDTKYGFNSFSGKALVNDSDIEGIGHIKLVTGRFINSENEIILTRDAAKTIGKKIGDEFKVTEISSLISINSSSNLRKKEIKEDLKVVGIIDNLPNNQSGILQMSHINWLLFNSSELKFNSISIKTKNGQFEQVKNTLNQTYPQFIVIDGNALISVLKDIFLYITLLFISIGTIIIMIATLKSVNERTREIGVLKAIGWSYKQVMGLIIIESFVQLILAWIIALIIILSLIFLIAPHTNINIFILLKKNIWNIINIGIVSFILSLLIPLLGCLFPLLRVVRLKPTEALKYE